MGSLRPAGLTSEGRTAGGSTVFPPTPMTFRAWDKAAASGLLARASKGLRRGLWDNILGVLPSEAFNFSSQDSGFPSA